MGSWREKNLNPKLDILILKIKLPAADSIIYLTAQPVKTIQNTKMKNKCAAGYNEGDEKNQVESRSYTQCSWSKNCIPVIPEDKAKQKSYQ